MLVTNIITYLCSFETMYLMYTHLWYHYAVIYSYLVKPYKCFVYIPWCTLPNKVYFDVCNVLLMTRFIKMSKIKRKQKSYFPGSHISVSEYAHMTYDYLRITTRNIFHHKSSVTTCIIVNTKKCHFSINNLGLLEWR